MVVTPQQAMKAVDEGDRAVLQRLEAKIDQRIREEFPDFYGGVSVTPPADLKLRVRQRIERMYGEAGWNVEYTSDQRDGDFWRFKPKGENKGGRR